MNYFIFAFSWYLVTVALMWLFSGSAPRSVGGVLIFISQIITLVMAVVAVINFFTLLDPLRIVLR